MKRSEWMEGLLRAERIAQEHGIMFLEAEIDAADPLYRPQLLAGMIDYYCNWVKRNVQL